MTASPVKTAPRPPCAPYVEDCDDSEDGKIAKPPTVANSARKVTRRDEASDSGYSSHTFATGSSSQGSKKKGSSERSGILKVFGMGKKASTTTKKPSSQDKVQEKEKIAPPKTLRRHSMSRTQKKEDLRASAHESKEDPAKKRTTVPPVDARVVRIEPKPARPVITSATRQPPAVKIAPQSITIPQPDARPRPYPAGGRQRPYSYHGVPPMIYQQPAQYYHHAYAAPPMMASTMQSYHMPPPQIQYAPGPTSPNRIINYNINPTHPPSYFPPNAGQAYWADPPPLQPLRRMSMSDPRTIVEYPRVPRRLPQGPWMVAPGHQPMYVSEHSTLIESPEDYNGQFLLDDEEAYYRDAQRREKDRRTMPPPPVPQRPALGRSATTSAAQGTATRRSQRQSLELPTKSSRKPSLDSGRNQSPTKPKAVTRPSHSSGGSGKDVSPAEPSSPTLRRRSKGLSRPTSYAEASESKHESKIKAAEAYQEEQTGDAKPRNLTTDVVHRALRQKPESKTRSTKSEASRASSKRSDPSKSRRAHSDRSHSKHEAESVTVKIGRAILDPRGRSFDLRQKQDNVEIRFRGDAKPKESRLDLLKKGVRYIPASDDYSRLPELAYTRSRSQRRKSTTESILSPVGEDYYEAPKRTESRSRRSSRSTNGSRRPVLKPADDNYF